MSLRRECVLGATLAAICLSPKAFGQDAELGLDLTDATDYRPSLAIIGVTSADPEITPQVVEKLKVDKLSSSLVGAAEKLGTFATVVPPAEVFAKLEEGDEEGYTGALACAESVCFAALVAKLDVNVVSIGHLKMAGGKPQLELRTYTRFLGTEELSTTRADVRASQLEREAVTAFQQLLGKAFAPLALLKVKSNTQGATATLGKHPLGPVPLEKRVPPGSYALKVEATGFLPDELDLQLKANETKQVEANLVPKPPDLPQVVDSPVDVVEQRDAAPSGPPLWKRPGLYVAVAGAAVAGAGLLLGSGAKSVEARARDANGDGVLDVTRAQRQSAERDAVLANVLVGVGAAAVVGGTVWILISPSAPRASEDPLAMAVAVGGTFP